MSSSSKAASKFPTEDPYKVLGLEFGASATDISKAYRKLARSLHPDKTQNLTELEQQKANERFHDIQIARSFLLEPEHAETKRQYDAKYVSDKLRRETEEARIKGMSEKRKRMREQLHIEEEQAAQRNKKTTESSRRKRKNNAAVEELHRQGQKMRDAYAEKEYVNQEKERKIAEEQLQQRQIRLKWSRKKLKSIGEPSPSEHSIATQLSNEYNVKVENVLMIGSKGNLALVTLIDENSCDIIVNGYSNSDYWRATYVNKTKELQRQQQKQVELEHTVENINDNNAYNGNNIPSSRNNNNNNNNYENIQDWKVRRDAEREKILRQMEQKEVDGDMATNNDQNNQEEELPTRPFPPPFPNTDEDYNSTKQQPMSSLQKLEVVEDLILKGILSDEKLKEIKLVK